ncbi:glycosyl hydrolase family 28-related protein [Sphingomonas sp. Root241]|uniref:glycosyl hydrolase family 28-related protein n=1 Tax=Sphingomonas sp. Root241 TaxID=1736501 RepID=UPI0006F3A491|nr:glycosyl hydrolase family 28-related protein [Sphingomonas sp. Root241]KRC81711.1 hypothetical protein ASE13_04870 [Sphingomonas sp. Root241]
MLSIKSFGAVGNDKADDTDALNRAFATKGRRILVPAGTYRVSNLAPPACDAIIGEGEHRSILRIEAGSGLALAGYCQTHRDYQLQGNGSPGATGMHFGAANSGSFTVQNVRVRQFNGPGAIGIRYDRCLKSVFINVTAEENAVNELWHGEDPAFPTSLVHIGGVNTGARLEGGVIRSGAAITCIGRDFESNGREGLLFAPGGNGFVEGVVLDGCWFEDNWHSGGAVQILRAGSGYASGDRLTVAGGASSGPMVLVVDAVDNGGGLRAVRIVDAGAYSQFPEMPFTVSGRRGQGASLTLGFHLRLDGSDPNRKVWPSIRSCRFSMDIGTARAILAVGAGCNPTITDEWLAATMQPSIVLQGGAAATFPSASNRYDYSRVVSDEANKASWSLADWRDYLPTLAGDNDEASMTVAASSDNHCRFQRQGRTVRISGALSGTLRRPAAAVNLSLPRGIRAARDGEHPMRLVTGGRRESGGVVTRAGAGNLLLVRDGDGRWAPGPFTIHFDLQFEIS